MRSGKPHLKQDRSLPPARVRTARPLEQRRTEARGNARPREMAVASRFEVQNPAYRRTPLANAKYTGMNPALWRTLAISLIAMAIVFACYQMTLPDRDDFGFRFVVPPNAPGSIEVTSVQKNSPAAQAEIRSGDIITYGSTALQVARVRYPTPGSVVTLTVNGHRTARLITRQTPRLFSFLLAPFIIRLAFLCVAALLAWRRPEDPAARALVVFLFSYGLIISLDSGVLATPLLSLIVMGVLNTVLLLLGTSAAAVFAAKFPSGQAKPVPLLLAKISQALAVLGAIALIAATLFARSAAAVAIVTALVLGAFGIIVLLVVATLVLAYTQGEPTERQRRRWVFLLLGVALTAALVDLIVWNTTRLRLVDTISLLVLGALPLGLAYVILRHRVIDVGFVLNRAIVYTGVSVVIVAIFVIVETLLSKFVEQNSRIGSIAAQLVVALILGFSIRAIHARVDRFVDNVLFRERHLAEAALRLLAHDAPYITETGVLISRCIKAVQRYGHARAAGVWLANSPTFRPAQHTFENAKPVGENDAAVLAMRARRVSVDLPLEDSDLPGSIAFPMIVRGELLGVLVCGPKTDDETYAPDERDALASLAASAGHALDTIEVRELRRRLEALTAAAPPGGVATDEGRTEF